MNGLIDDIKQARYKRDRELVKRVQSGDESASWELANLYKPMIRGLAGFYSRMDSKLDPDDLEQEALIYVSKKAGNYDENRGAEVITYIEWLITGSIKNHLRGHRKRTDRLTSLMKQIGKDESFLIDILKDEKNAPSDEQSSNNELAKKAYELVHKYIPSLEPFEQNIVYGVLKYQSFKEIAKSEGRSRYEIKERYKRILRKLKKLMKHERPVIKL